MTTQTLYKGKKTSFEAVMGLEVHAQIVSASKLFSASAAHTFTEQPNTCVSFLDAGFPGMLPVLNEHCVRQGIKTGLGLQATVCLHSVFERKNYFYPDNPTGYQISQNQYPLVQNGYMDITDASGQPKRIRIQRLHLEQDAGKSFHDKDPRYSYLDFNRAGVGLMEIVSHPDLSTPEEVIDYVKRLRSLLRYLGTCDGNMEKGNLRVDANISIREVGAALGTRVELKNMNSFRFLHHALVYEIERQIALVEEGQTVVQETRLFDVKKGITLPMREKEEACDYRYFPDPDLPTCVLPQELIDEISHTLGELPHDKQKRFVSELGLSSYDAALLTEEKAIADYFEEVVCVAGVQHAKSVANWIIGEVFATLNRLSLPMEERPPLSIQHLADLVLLIAAGDLSSTLAKTVFVHMWETGQDPQSIMEEKGLKQVSDTALLETFIKTVLEREAQQVADYLAGKEKLFSYFLGQVMKEAKGRAHPQETQRLLKKHLEDRRP